MSPQVTAAWIAVSGVVLTVIATVIVQYLGRRATSQDVDDRIKAEGEHLDAQFKEQREQLKTTLAAQSEQLDKTLAEQRARTLNERFATAAEQLGNDKPAAVRLAGVYAMAGLADDWRENRQNQQTCIDVLCGFLRLPYDPDPGADPAQAELAAAYRAGREVRHTVIRVISAHLQANAPEPRSWRGLDFDFTGAVFDGGDFSGAQFTGGQVSFADAEFTSGRVTFRDAEFTGGEVSFYGATFSDGEVSFERAKFAGGKVNFFWAVFHKCGVHFNRAEFTGPMVGFDYARFLNRGRVVTFDDAVFSGGLVSFGTAHFDGGVVHFRGAKFDGSRFDFRALFSDGEVSFERAEFTGGTVSFDRATLNGGLIRFDGAVFSGGLVSFGSRDVTSGEWTGGALSGSRISFDGAAFTGGTVTWAIPVLSGELDFSKVRDWSSPPTDWRGRELSASSWKGPTPPGVKFPEKKDLSQE